MSMPTCTWCAVLAHLHRLLSAALLRMTYVYGCSTAGDVHSERTSALCSARVCEASDHLLRMPCRSISTTHAWVQVSVKSSIPEDAFVLDEAEVDAIKYIPAQKLEQAYRDGDSSLVPANLDSEVRRVTCQHDGALHDDLAAAYDESANRYCGRGCAAVSCSRCSGEQHLLLTAQQLAWQAQRSSCVHTVATPLRTDS